MLPSHRIESADAHPAAADTELSFEDFIEGELPDLPSPWDLSTEKVGRNEFDFQDFPAVEGEYVFDVEQSLLNDLVAVAKCTVRDVIKLSVSATRLRARTFDGGAFSEITVPVYGCPRGIPEGQNIDLYASVNALEETVKAIRGIARFGVQLDKRRLNVASERFERPLVLHPATAFLDLDPAQIGPDLAVRHPFDPSILRRALAYVAPAVVPDDVQDFTDLVEIRDGHMIGGTRTVIAVAATTKLPPNMRFRHRFIEPLLIILTRLKSGWMIETDKFYVLQDESITFGFEKKTGTFPMGLAQLLETRVGRDRIILARSSVVDALSTLGKVLEQDSGLARIRCRKDAPSVGLTMTAEMTGGRQVRSLHEGRRCDLTEQSIDLFVPVGSFWNAARAYPASNLYLDFYLGDQPLLVVTEDLEDDFRTQTLIGLSRTKSAAKTAALTNVGEASDNEHHEQ